MKEIKLRLTEQVRIIIESSDGKLQLLSVSGFLVDAGFREYLTVKTLYGEIKPPPALALDFRAANNIIEGDVIIVDGKPLLPEAVDNSARY